MNGPLLQLLVLVILLLTEPHQSASSTMVISTVCVCCDLSLICEKCVCDMQCVSYVCDECGSLPFVSSHQHSPPEVTKGQGSKVTNISP